MQAQELRIGNWVFDLENNRFDQITTVEEKRVSLKNGVLPYTPFDKIQPIPLTPEILEKCGFNLIIEPRYGDYYYKQPVQIPLDFKFYKHLHQLQNLIHALTGEELEVRL